MGTQHPDLDFLKSFFIQRNQDSLGKKWLIPQLGLGRYKVSLEHLKPESKKVFKKKKNERDILKDIGAC